MNNPLMAKVSTAITSIPAYLPTRFNVAIGGFFSEEFSVGLEKEALTVQKGVPIGIPSAPITPSPEAWQTFWYKLDLLGVWKWRKSYWNDEIMDGTQWEVDIRYGKKRVKSDGSNSYPLEDGSPSDEPTKPFGEFEKAVAELCGIEITQDPDDEDPEDASVEWQYYVCPRCGSKKAVEIIYGMPTGDAFKLSEEGKLIIGGCCQEHDDPDRSCPDCNHEWNSTKSGKTQA